MTDKTSAGNRLRLALLVLLFAAPVLGAYSLYFWLPRDWQPRGHTHQGELINPARPIETPDLQPVDSDSQEGDLLQDKWTLLMMGPSKCDEACAQTLRDTRQVRTALGKNTARVRRVYVATDRADLEALRAWAVEQHPDLELVVAADAQALAGQLVHGGRNPLQHPRDVYLLDPHGNWLMRYTPDVPAKGLLKDLKKLLRLSNIG